MKALQEALPCVVVLLCVYCTEVAGRLFAA